MLAYASELVGDENSEGEHTRPEMKEDKILALIFSFLIFGAHPLPNPNPFPFLPLLLLPELASSARCNSAGSTPTNLLAPESLLLTLGGRCTPISPSCLPSPSLPYLSLFDRLLKIIGVTIFRIERAGRTERGVAGGVLTEFERLR